MSLRTRLLLGIVTLVAVGLLVADVATYRFLQSSLIERVDGQLDGARFAAMRELGTEGGSAGGPGGHPRGEGPVDLVEAGTYAALLDPAGRIIRETTFTFGEDAPSPPSLQGALPGSTDAAAPSTRSVLSVDSTDGSISYRVLADPLPRGTGTLVVAIPLGDVTGTLGRLLAIEALVTIAVLAAVGALAFWLVRGGLRPLERIGETAGAIASGELSRRVESVDPRTEVGRLGIALNAMLAHIERAFEERTRSEERLRRFVADASHELRTPLTSIRGYAELFRRGAADRPEDLALVMRRIEQEGSRMGELVDELLLLARLDQGRPLDREDVDLAEVVSAAVDAARAAAPDRAFDLAADRTVVLGDSMRLRQVVDNLLGNAREHTTPGTPVHVSLRSQGTNAVLEVRDEGPGISGEDAPRVFERFYRTDSSRSERTAELGWASPSWLLWSKPTVEPSASSQPPGEGPVSGHRCP